MTFHDELEDDRSPGGELASARIEMRECFPYVYEDGRQLYMQIRLLKEILVQELCQSRQELNKLARRIAP